MQIKEKDLENLKIEVNSKVTEELKGYNLPEYFRKVKQTFENPSYKKMMKQINMQNEIYANAMRSMFQSSTFDILKNQVQAIQFTIPNYINDSIALQLSNLSSACKLNYGRILEPTKQISEMMANITRMNLDIIPNIINSIEFKNIFSNIEFNEFKVNEDGSVQYEDESVFLVEESSDEIISILKSIGTDVKDIKDSLTKKGIAVILFLFIITNIFGGFFNKVGETVFDTITSAYANFVKENELENTEENQKAFMESYLIVNANELNVRSAPSSDSQLVGMLYRNQCVKIVERIPYWTKIEYNNIIGWVFNRYLIKFDENTSSLISIEN